MKYVASAKRFHGGGVTFIKQDEVIKGLVSLLEYDDVIELSKLDDSILIIPRSIIYINGEFFGYSMDYAGESLFKILLERSMEFDERVSLCKQLKRIGEYLSQNYLVYLDIHLANLLFDNDLLRLTDLDNIFKFRIIDRVVGYYDYWISCYGKTPFTDNLAINYLTFHILNNEDIYSIFGDSITYLTKQRLFNLTDDINQVFLDDAWNYFRSILRCENKDNEEIKKLKNKPINLVDYIK